MEMMWNAGEGGTDGELFTGVNHNNYSPPPGTDLQMELILFTGGFQIAMTSLSFLCNNYE